MSFDKNAESLYEMMKSQNRDHHIHLKLENGHKIFINSDDRIKVVPLKREFKYNKNKL